MQKKEFIKLKFNGQEITINRVWGGHRFTDEEVQKLLANEEISFSKTSQRGTEYTVKGKLMEQEYEGKTFFVFKRTNNQSDETAQNNTEVDNDDVDELF